MRIITVVGGSLYEIAAKELGNALQWANIARQNKLTDPMLSGIYELTIPQSLPDYDDGIGPQ